VANANIKSKFRDVLGLINSTLGGKIYSLPDGTYEIHIENSMHNLFTSFFIKREEGEDGIKMTISFKQGRQ